MASDNHSNERTTWLETQLRRTRELAEKFESDQQEIFPEMVTEFNQITEIIGASKRQMLDLFESLTEMSAQVAKVRSVVLRQLEALAIGSSSQAPSIELGLAEKDAKLILSISNEIAGIRREGSSILSQLRYADQMIDQAGRAIELLKVHNPHLGLGPALDELESEAHAALSLDNQESTLSDARRIPDLTIRLASLRTSIESLVKRYGVAY